KVLIAYDEGATIVLQGCRKDLACRSAQFVDQHNHRAGEKSAPFPVLQDVNIAVGVLDLNDRTLIDKQSTHFDGFIKRPSAVFTQIDHQALNLVLLETFQKGGHIA